MQRIPDTYYTNKMLDGNTQYNSPRQESPKFFQGEDIELSFYLNINGQPVSLEKYDVYAVVKKSVYATTVLWQADTFTNVGLRKEGETPGYFSVWIPRILTSTWLPGTYYMDVLLEEKPGTVNRNEQQLVVLQADFLLQLSTTSPNPKTGSPVQVQLISVDNERIRTFEISSPEQTMPPHLPLPS